MVRGFKPGSSLLGMVQIVMVASMDAAANRLQSSWANRNRVTVGKLQFNNPYYRYML